MFKLNRLLIILLPVIAHADQTYILTAKSKLLINNGKMYVVRDASIAIASSVELANPSSYTFATSYNWRTGLDSIFMQGNFAKKNSSIVDWVYANNNPSLNNCGNEPCYINTKDKNAAFYSNFTWHDKTPAKLTFANVVNLKFSIYGRNSTYRDLIQSYICRNVTVGDGGKNWWIFNNYPPGYVFDSTLPAIGKQQLLCTNSQGRYNVLRLLEGGSSVIINPLYVDYNY
jgi:hypothetical protein